MGFFRTTKVKVRSRPAIYSAIRSLKPGRRRERMKLRKAMMNFVLEEIAERHWEAFNSKSEKMADEFKTKWARLAAETIAKKGHDTIGVETGHMRASFTPGYTTPDGHYIKGHQDQIAEATAYSVLFGTDAVEVRKGKRRPKAKFFHYGRTRQPARPFWHRRHMKKWIADGIQKAMPYLARMMKEGR